MEFKANQPIYLQIADLIMEKIVAGEWLSRVRVPSVRETASQMEVNPNTVINAYSFLQDHEIIYNQRGIGYHVSPEGQKQARQLKRENFIQKELPYMFRTMRTLDMGMSEIEGLYNDFLLKSKN